MEAAPIQLITKILLPFSVLSVLSVILSYLLLAYGSQEQLFSFSIDKNYMFLVCNGLLVVIATSSGLIGSSSVETDSKAEDRCRQLEESCDQKKLGSIAEAKVNSPEVDQGSEEERNEIIVVVEEDEDEGLGLMSKEELNKKCEDFIRKMKEGIKFEAGRQLIMVQ